MMERITRAWMFMGMAEMACQRSTCRRMHVGVVITDKAGTSVVSIGYNGNARRLGNSCDHLSDCIYCQQDIKVNDKGVHIINDLTLGTQAYRCTATPITGDCGCIHAEANALIKAPFHQGPLTLYTTVSPCRDCAKLIINSAVTKVFYLEQYRSDAGLILLKKGEIAVEQLHSRQMHEQLELV